MKLPKDQLAETNDLNPILEEIDTTIADLKEEMDNQEMPEFPTEISVSNLPEVQRVEITNLPEEKDDSEQIQTLKDIKEALAAFSSKDVNLAQVESLLSELIQMSSSEEEIDLRPKFDELKAILNTLNDNIASIESPLPFDYIKLAEIIRENVKIRGGGGSAGVEYVKNVAGQQINPSTEEKQDDIITAINNIQDTETVDELEKHTDVLNEIKAAVQAISSAKGVAADMRVTLLSGTVTTVTTVTTVATVTTVTGITNIGGIPAVQLIPSNQNIAAVLSNINNVTV
jgi:hypothetical protein